MRRGGEKGEEMEGKGKIVKKRGLKIGKGSEEKKWGGRGGKVKGRRKLDPILILDLGGQKPPPLWSSSKEQQYAKGTRPMH